MANQHDIKKYLIEGDKPYFKQENRNGEILMLSGVWGSGKTHFWKNDIEEKIIENLKKENKSYVFVSLYGKDSIEELQNEIYQLSYSFSTEDSNNLISSAFSVFTKVASFMPIVSFFDAKIDIDKTATKLNDENLKQQLERGLGRLKDGGIICFDDFERKSSKIDLNDLFGFITNLTEVFQTKTIIITNQEFFKENDSELFSKIKEKSVNKFLLLDPTVEELFETIYTQKYSALDIYKLEILKAIKITEEKNARIFIQVLDNCLEYNESAKDEHEIFMLVLITILFVKYNVIFRMENVLLPSGTATVDKYLPSIANKVPSSIISKIVSFSTLYFIKEEVIYTLRTAIENSKGKRDENLKEDLKFINENQNLLYQIYKYNIKTDYFKKEDNELIEKLNNFVESGILSNE